MLFRSEAPLGQGRVDIDACMAHLHRVGYRGAYALETWYEDDGTITLQDYLARDCERMLRWGANG